MSDKTLSVVPASSNEPVVAGVSRAAVGPVIEVERADGTKLAAQFRRLRVYERQKVDRDRDVARAFLRGKYKGFDTGDNTTDLFTGSYAYRLYSIAAPYLAGAWAGEGPAPAVEDLMGLYDDDLDRLQREVRRLNPVGGRDLPGGEGDDAPLPAPANISEEFEVEDGEGEPLACRVRRLTVGERLAVARARDAARLWLSHKFPGYESNEDRSKLFEAASAYALYSVAAPYVQAAWAGEGPAPTAEALAAMYDEELDKLLKEIRRYNPTAIDLPDPKEA